jgi:hypothetical protein
MNAEAVEICGAGSGSSYESPMRGDVRAGNLPGGSQEAPPWRGWAELGVGMVHRAGGAMESGAAWQRQPIAGVF